MSTAPAPTFDPNDNNAYLVYIPSAVFVVICPVLLTLRLWARLRNGGKLGADDWTAIAALVSGPCLKHAVFLSGHGLEFLTEQY